MKLIALRKGEQNLAAVDPWTLVHVAAGLALGLMAVPRSAAFGAAVGYEIVEQFVERSKAGREFFNTEHPESPANAVVDVVVFAAGYWLGGVWNRTR
jgi:hypothetical protein